jgi:tripartite-type tricarboxylate transporter receptor subunit TctC
VKRLAAVLLVLGCNAFAQVDFPSRPIRILVPTTAGGVPDVLARSVGQRMAESLGQPASSRRTRARESCACSRYRRRSAPR